METYGDAGWGSESQAPRRADMPNSTTDRPEAARDMAALEEMAAVLEGSGDYKVLRRINADFSEKLVPEAGERIAICLDVETTGTDKYDEIIELAFVPFIYRPDGKITAIGRPSRMLQQPSGSIPDHITRLTGLCDDDVRGKRIDRDLLASRIEPASFIIAHNAAFDRHYCERLLPLFVQKPWACSQQEVDWAGLGVEGLKLSYIVAHFGFFYDKHHAESDALAVVEVLRQRAGFSTVFSQLLTSARQATCRIWAEGAPFDLKDILKLRRYRWSDGSGGQPRAWYRDVPENRLEAELTWLRDEILGFDADPPVKRLTAFERYSERG